MKKLTDKQKSRLWEQQRNVNFQASCLLEKGHGPSAPHIETLELGPFHWFGGEPGSPLPDLGERPVKHSKGNAGGVKTVRPMLRQVRKSDFERIDTMDKLATAMFGASPVAERAALLAHIREAIGDTPIDPSEPEWVTQDHELVSHTTSSRFVSKRQVSARSFGS